MSCYHDVAPHSLLGGALHGYDEPSLFHRERKEQIGTRQQKRYVASDQLASSGAAQTIGDESGDAFWSVRASGGVGTHAAVQPEVDHAPF